jgi:ParB family chromosome partitioning protein
LKTLTFYSILKNFASRLGTRDSHSIAVTVKDIPVGDISIKENIRKDYTGIEELKASIKLHGLLQPVTVYPEEEGYIIKTGHRRFKAFQLLYQEEPERFHSIRCLVSTSENIAVIQLVENVQRADLSQIDLFNALVSLREQGMTLKQIADVMGKSEQYIKFLFIGVHELNSDEKLKERVSIAGNTIQDIVETKGVNKEKRLNLLEQRKTGAISRADMRKQVRKLKTPKPKSSVTTTTKDFQRIHICIQAYPDLKEILIYPVKPESSKYLASIKKDLQDFFSQNSGKYCLEKILPDSHVSLKNKDL